MLGSMGAGQVAAGNQKEPQKARRLFLVEGVLQIPQVLIATAVLILGSRAAPRKLMRRNHRRCH